MSTARRRALPARRALVPAPQQRASQPPEDPQFFMTLRMLQRGQPLKQPFAEHPWVYAVNEACATTLAAVPFRVYKDVGARGAKPAWERNADRTAAGILKVAPGISRSRAAWIASRPETRVRLRELRRSAPWLTPDVLCRAITGAELVEDGDWYDLFRRPNPAMTRAQLWEALWVFMGLDGECFWQLYDAEGRKLPDPKAVPEVIVPCSGSGWEPRWADKAKTVLNGWKFSATKEGKPVKEEFELHQVVHWYYFNPYNRLRGLSPYKPVEREVQSDHMARAWNEAFFENSAMPSGHIVSEKPMSPDKERELIEQYEARHSGVRKSHRPTIFSGGVRFVEAGSSHRDMDFLNLRTMARDVVFGASRTPRSVLGLNEDINRASMDRSTRNWWDSTLLPRVQYAEDLLDSDLFTDDRVGKDGMWGAFDLSVVEALREDLGEKLGAAAKLFDLGYTINEINERLELGMNPLAWGDIGYRPFGYEVAGEGDEKAPPAEEPEEKPAEEGARRLAAAASSAAAATEIALARVRRDAALLRREANAKRWARLLKDIFVPGERAFERRYRGFLAALRARQLQLIEAADLTRVSMPDQILFGLKEQQTEAVRRTAPVYASTFAAAEKEAQAEVDEVFEGLAAPAGEERAPKRDTILKNLSLNVGVTVRTIRRQLRVLIGEALAAGATKDDLKKTVRATLNRVAAGGRLGSIARTEIGATVSAARDFVFSEGGVPGAEWLTAGDELVRDTHVVYGEAGAQAIGFNWAELVSGGYTLERPHDPRAPSEETINCRCVLFPVGKLPGS